MIIVTGGAGFIGSNIVHGLNQRGLKDILVVDDLTEGVKFKNLVDCQIMDYMDMHDFLAMIETNQTFAESVSAVFHQGACSDTTEWDGVFMMKNNYDYSKAVFHYCQAHGIPLIYASSAAVYGASTTFKEQLPYEKPLNVYGYSKFLFDQYVRRHQTQLQSQVVGLRYFNVYGPREFHKGSMASVAWHNHCQLQETGKVKLFAGYEGYGPGEQRRDFIYVGDVVDVNCWLMDNPAVSGIFNLGSGRSQTFNELSQAVLAWHQRGSIEYIEFPEKLKGRYQSFTEADMSALRAAGYDQPFKTVEQGVKLYLDWLA